MKRYLLFNFLLLIPLTLCAQIVADHHVVDRYDDIPGQYMDEVKKMWLVLASESHGQAYLTGLENLESDDSDYDVSVAYSGTPEGYTTSHLRASGATWGDIDNASGWIHGYGPEDWCSGSPPYWPLNSAAVERTKAGILYCNSNNLTMSAFGFGWCYNDGYDLVHSYLTATKEYNDYCKANNINTVVIFTTGPVDGYMGEGTQDAYENSLRWQTIRDTVNNINTRVLLDYADILSYNNAGEQATATWNGHTFPVIHPENMEGGYTGHIGENGALKLAKATWWMLARIAGWDSGGTSSWESDAAESEIKVDMRPNQLSINSPEEFIDGQISLYNAHGSLLNSRRVNSNLTYLDTSQLSDGMYLLVLSKESFREVRKIAKVL